MNKKGMLLVDVLLGLCIFGIVVVTCLPLFNTALNNKEITQRKLEMIYAAESIMEQIKNYNDTWPIDFEIHGVNIHDLINQLNTQDQSEKHFLIEEENMKWKYSCITTKDSINNKLWEINIQIIFVEGDKNEDVSLWCLIQNPKLE